METPEITRRRVLAGSGVAALLGAAWVFSGGSADLDEWPMYGFDAENTGYADDGGGVGGFSERWRASTKAPVYSTPAVVDDVVYATLVAPASPRDAEVPAMKAYDAPSGDLLWEAPDEVNMLEGSTPAVVDDRLYMTAWGDVVALDRGNGDLLWRRDLESPSQHSATVRDGVVYAATNAGTVEAYAAEDGERLWRTDLDAAVVQTAPAVSADAVYVAGSLPDSGAAAYGIDASTGEQMWSHEADGGSPGSPALADETVYVAVERDAVYAFDAAHDPDERVKWRWTPESENSRVSGSSPAVTGEEVVAVADGFYDIDREDGKTTWSDTSPEVSGGFNDQAPSPTVVADTVLASTGSRKVYAVSLSPGEITSSVEVDDRVYGSVGVGDGAVFFGDGEGLYAFDAVARGPLDLL